MSTHVLWRRRLISAGIAFGAFAVASVALLTPHLPKQNWVWEWDQLVFARVAAVSAVFSALAAVGMAVLIWRRPTGRLLGAEGALATVAVASALLLTRSGSWLSDMQVVIP